MDLSRATTIEGWMNLKELEWIANQAKEAKVIIEVGCLKGRSTRAWCDNTEGIVYAVDTWAGPYYANNGKVLWDQIYLENARNEFHVNLKDCGNLIVYRGNFQDFSEFLTTVPDIIFIDGDHRYENVKNDLLTACQIIKPGGIISGHDYGHEDWPGVRQAVDEFFPQVYTEKSIWWTVQ